MAHMLGGKLTASHTTLNDLAQEVVEFLDGLDCVTKISLGVISNRAGRGSQAPRSVKIIAETNCVLVRCTQKGSISELRFYTTDRPVAILNLARFVRNSGWNLRFR